MDSTTIALHSDFVVGQVDPRIFGGFLEHMGRAVYEGVYDPVSPHADRDGFRSDVLDVLRGLDMTAMRYPGGNFASGYHWLDGVGPLAERPRVRELAWQSIETNHVGTDEYVDLCRKMGWTPMISVNLGTGTPEEARDWVEYCNCPGGTRYADLRLANGHEEPHGVKLWCLGNEMDGRWQLGHVPAKDYAIRAQQSAKMMRDVDRSIELVVCGSCTTEMASYMNWDREVLEYVGGLADYVSLHRYVGNRSGDTPDYLAVTASIDRQIEEMDAVCRFAQAQRRGRRRPYLCFDEWNVWYKNMEMAGEGKVAPHLIEEIYNLEDALVVAGFLHSFVRHADVVKIANIAQIVNVIAPIQTIGDDVLIQSIYHPFAMFSSRRNGVSLQLAVKGPGYKGATNGSVNYVDASAILDGEKLQVFLTNRSLDETSEVRIAPADMTITSCESGEILAGPDATSFNTLDNGDVVAATPFTGIEVKGGQAICTIPPLSFVATTLTVK